MKNLLMLGLFFIAMPISLVKAETVYMRAYVPVTLEQCQQNIQHKLIGLLERSALDNGLRKEIYFYPRAKNCDLMNKQQVIVAHGFFSGDKNNVERLVSYPPRLGTGTLEVFKVKDFEARYYIYTNTTTLNLENIFVRRFNSMEIELNEFVRTICYGGGGIGRFIEALQSSPRVDAAMEAINRGTNFLNLGYNNLEVTLENGLRLEILPLLQDRWGEEWRCF
ncbi:MAG: hypothetical protein RJB66_496 [Pseudomonadota bacterium]|jgi:hypothetical protein